MAVCVDVNRDDDTEQKSKQFVSVAFAGLHRARAISHSEEGLGIVQGLDERYVQCEFKTSGRLLPMLERLVRRVFVSAQKQHHRPHKDSFLFDFFYNMCSAFIYKLIQIFLC